MKKIIIILAFALTLLACSSVKYEEMPVAERMKIAEEYYKNESYKSAAEIYKTVVFERQSSLTPKAQFALAECYFMLEEWEDARFEYNEMIRLFPDYSTIGESYYKLGICYQNESLGPNYTQDETYRAIDAFEIYLDKFRNAQNRSDAIKRIKDLRYKLLEKKFINGLTYYRIDDYSSALMYFNEIIELGNEDELELKSVYWSFRIHMYRKDFDKALVSLNKLEKTFTNKEFTLDARQRYDKENN